MRKQAQTRAGALRDERKRRAREAVKVDVSPDPGQVTPELARRILQASPLKHRAAAESLAADAARIEAALVDLERKRREGPLTEDEHKAANAYVSNKRRLFETLGVVGVSDEEDEGL